MLAERLGRQVGMHAIMCAADSTCTVHLEHFYLFIITRCFSLHLGHRLESGCFHGQFLSWMALGRGCLRCRDAWRGDALGLVGSLHYWVAMFEQPGVVPDTGLQECLGHIRMGQVSAFGVTWKREGASGNCSCPHGCFVRLMGVLG